MAQTEYGLAYALVFGLVFLGILVICIPRPRKRDLPEKLAKEREAKLKAGSPR